MINDKDYMNQNSGRKLTDVFKELEQARHNYEQENLSRKDKVARIFIAFIEKDTKAPSSDGVYIVLDIDAITKILNYIESIIKF